MTSEQIVAVGKALLPLPIPPGDPVHFFSDGGYEPRDGTYVCRSCATKIAKQMHG